MFHAGAEFLGGEISKLNLVYLVPFEAEPLIKRKLPSILLEASTHNLTYLVSEIPIWEVFTPFFHYCGNFTIRMVSSHLLHSLHRSMDAPSNAAPHPTLHGAPSLHDLWPSSLCLSLLSLFLLVLLRSPEPCLTWAPSLWEPLSLIVGAGPCTLTCQCSEPLESTGTTHQ